jgi:hypothetical protein
MVRTFRYVVTGSSATSVLYTTQDLLTAMIAGAAATDGIVQYYASLINAAKLQSIRVYAMAGTADSEPVQFKWKGIDTHGQPESAVSSGTRAFPATIIALPPKDSSVGWWWAIATAESGSDIELFTVIGLNPGDVVDITIEYIMPNSVDGGLTGEYRADPVAQVATAAATHASGVMYRALGPGANVLPLGLASLAYSFVSNVAVI